MKIVTISREFGSGGRELGKRLAQQLGFAYCDREIVAAVARKSELSEEYAARAGEQAPGFPLTFRRTLSLPAGQQPGMKVLLAQREVLKELAARGEDCVIVGRGADVVLAEYRPLNLFVYAAPEAKLHRYRERAPEAKLHRCRERAPEGEQLAGRELSRRIRQVDAGRAQYYRLISGRTWGQKEHYHLCVNTTGLNLKSVAPWAAGFVQSWFREEGSL